LKKKPEIKMELKPYPNEHSARLQDPDKSQLGTSIKTRIETT